jgi:hypothetical protein
MSVAAVILNYVHALVWPLVAVFALVVFRIQIGHMMSRLAELNMPGASMRFADAKLELVDRFSTATAVNIEQKAWQADGPAFRGIEDQYAGLSTLAGQRPREAVLRSWALLSDFAYTQAGPTARGKALPGLIQQLVHPESVPMCTETVRALDETHGEITSGWSQVTAPGARHFVHAAERVAVEILAGSPTSRP